MALTYHRKKNEQKDKNTADPWKLACYGLGFEKNEQPQTPLSESITGMFKDEQIACWLDGDAPLNLHERIIREMRHNKAFARFVASASHIDTEGELSETGTFPKSLPLGAQAATETCGQNFCGLHCETYLMNRFQMPFDTEERMQRARSCGWLTEQGMHIGHIGDGLEADGLTVEKHFDATLSDLASWLKELKGIIAVIDGGELTGNRTAEHEEDLYVGEIPDHAVVVLSTDSEAGTITVYDPQSAQATDTYPTDVFTDAWEDSCRYAIVVSRPTTENTEKQHKS